MGFNLGHFIGNLAAGDLESAIGSAVDEDKAKANYKWQEKHNIRLWNMQNEYNSPEAQMQRYIDAGLNPNLIYSMQNTASDISSPSFNYTSDTVGNATKMTSANNQSLITKQQLLNMDSARQQQNAQTLATYEQIEKTKNDIKNQNAMLPYQQALMKAQAENLLATVNSPEWLSKFIGKKNADRIVSALDGNKPAEENPGFTLFKYKGESYGF